MGDTRVSLEILDVTFVSDKRYNLDSKVHFIQLKSFITLDVHLKKDVDLVIYSI
jgi:hypothetical protein